MSASLILIVSCILLLAFAGYKIWQVVQLSRRISASKMWPTIAGMVASKKVREHWTQKSGKSYHPEFTVKYSIMGQEYEKTVSLPGIFSKNSAEKALGEIGATIEVRYNPENPAETVTGQEKVNIADILLIIFCLGIPVFLLVTQIR